MIRCLYLRSMRLKAGRMMRGAYKVSGLNLVIYFNHMFLFEWWVDRCTFSKHTSKDLCFKWDWIMCSKCVDYLRFNSQQCTLIIHDNSMLAPKHNRNDLGFFIYTSGWAKMSPKLVKWTCLGMHYLAPICSTHHFRNHTFTLGETCLFQLSIATCPFKLMARRCMNKYLWLPTEDFWLRIWETAQLNIYG